MLEEYEVYDPLSGITNNICESLNATIKRLMSWKEAPIDAMILSLYYLQGFFKYEILRGKCGLGQFNLKDIHKNCQVDRDIVEFPNDVITPTEIIDRVKGNIQESIQQLTKDEATCQNQETPEENDQKSTSTTQRSLALSAIRDNKVHLHTSAKSFVVEGTKGDKYAVTLHPKESCQCGALGTCWHIIAAKLSIGDEDGKEKKVYNLTQLRRNHRKKPNKKAGKKKPRPCDDDFEETIINVAPDSSIKNKIEIRKYKRSQFPVRHALPSSVIGLQTALEKHRPKDYGSIP